MADRQPFTTIVTGAPGHGKSQRTEEEMKMYVLTDTRQGRKGRKALIFDTNNEYEERYEPIRYEVDNKKDNGYYIARLDSPKIRIISPFNSFRKPMTFSEKEKTLVDIITNYRNGLVLLEDINTYLIGAKSADVISLLCAARHKGIDLIIHLQSLSAVETRMWQNAGVIRFHYQVDDIHRYRERIPNFELMKIAQNIVSSEYHTGKQDSKYFFVYVDVRSNKISGCTKEQFIKGCLDYIDRYMKADLKHTAKPKMIQKMMLYYNN